MFSAKSAKWLLLALFLLGMPLKLVAAERAEAQLIEVSPQYGANAVTLYLIDENEQYLLPVSRRVSAEEATDPRRALAGLITGPLAGPELRAVLLPDTDILSFEVVDDTAVINLSTPAFATAPLRAIDAIRLTMTEFAGITAVSLMLDNQPIDAAGNIVDKPVTLARPATINTEHSAEGSPVTMYYGYAPNPKLLVPMTQYVPDADNMVAQVTEQLLAGPPSGSGLVSVIPADVALLDAGLEDGIAFIDLSEELVFAYRLKEANALHVRKAVIATLTSLPDVYAGSIEIGGSSLLYFSCQNVVMEHPQAKPWAINDEFYMDAIEE